MLVFEAGSSWRTEIEHAKETNVEGGYVLEAVNTC